MSDDTVTNWKAKIQRAWQWAEEHPRVSTIFTTFLVGFVLGAWWAH